MKVPGFTQFSSLSEMTRALDHDESPVVLIPAFNAFDDLIKCLSSMDRHSPTGTDVLVIDDGSPSPGLAGLISSLSLTNLSVLFWRREKNLGLITTANQGFQAAGRRDVVLANSDIIVGPKWLEGLQAAVRAHNLVATATAMTNSGSLVSVPNGTPKRRLPGDHSVDSAALAVASSSARRYPELPFCVGHLVYIRRAALDLIGGFDESFSPGYGEEIDFALRAVAAGLKHVCADDVFVFHAKGASFGFEQAAEDQRVKGTNRIRRRYPFFLEWTEEFSANNRSALAASIATASIAIRGLHLLVDARCLDKEAVVGTQRVTESLIAALGENPRITRLGVVISEGTDRQAVQAVLAGLPRPDLETFTESELAQVDQVFDLAFRPYQVHDSTDELLSLGRAARRVALWQLDFIAYDNPFYLANRDEWRQLRDLTRFAMENADGVALPSRWVLADGTRKGLLGGEFPRTRVIHPGTDTRPPQHIDQLPPALAGHDRYVLGLGTDYLHKNRPFALEVLAGMMDCGYPGSLVLAGPHVKDGSSGKAEEALVKRHPSLRGRTVVLGALSGCQRDTVLAKADLVLYPSLAEGFGLIPFEASAWGVPCLPSRQGSLDEILPPGIMCIEQWDASVVAGQAMKLIDDIDARKLQVHQLQEKAEEFTWSRCADEVIDFAIDVCGSVGSANEGRMNSAESSAAQPAQPRLISHLDRLATIVDNPTVRWARLARATTIALRPTYRAIKKLAARR